MSEESAFAVKLDSFEGPLDLLLHLVMKHEMDIHDIPMAQITAQYLECLEQMQQQNLDIASEFLLMAATLIHIKAKMLLPALAAEEGDDDGGSEDPRLELAQRLLEYQRYQEAARRFEQGEQLHRDVFVRPGIDDEEELPSTAMSDASVYDLVVALRRLLKEKPAPVYHQVRVAEFSIDDARAMLLERLRGKEFIEFSTCFAAAPGRGEVVVTFVALLDLVKLRRCRIVQLAPGATLYIYARVDEESRE